MDEVTYAHSAQQQTPTSREKEKGEEDKLGTVVKVWAAKAAKDGEAKAREQAARDMDGAKARAQDPGKEFTDLI